YGFTNAWYEEIDIYDYDFNNPNYQNGTGHFTQVVWKDTKMIGCATAESNGRVYLACEYYPPGNVVDYFIINVLPPL
ncbi:Golgi-associated plant pathogenesis-related protein 1-like, partial [Saccoglossus kowalevskii]